MHYGPSRAPWSIPCTVVHPMPCGSSRALSSIPCPVIHTVHCGPSRALWSIPCTVVHPVHHESIRCTMGPSYAVWSIPCTVVHPVHCGMLNLASAHLMPVDPSPSCNNQKCLQTLLSVSSGTNSPWVRTTAPWVSSWTSSRPRERVSF